MDSLIWIRLLAYGERVTFEETRVVALAAARRAALRRQQRLAELRVAFLRFIEAQLESAQTSAVAYACVADGSHDGFIVGASNGHGVSAVSVKPFAAGIRCAYWRDGESDSETADIDIGVDAGDALRIISHAHRDTQFPSAAELVNHLTAPLLRATASPHRAAQTAVGESGER